MPVRNFRSRRLAPPSAEGRWSLVGSRAAAAVSPTEWSTATAQQLLSRYGVVTREVAAAEGITGGFSAVYDVLKALEDAGRIRRGYFVGGVGATQFALPAALDLLRSLREMPERGRSRPLAATDPANPYGTILPWPSRRRERRRPPHHAHRRLAGHPRQRRARRVHQPRRAPAAGLPAGRRAGAINGRPRASPAGWRRWREQGGLLVAEINGIPTAEHPIAPFLIDAGFTPSAMGFMMRRSAYASPDNSQLPTSNSQEEELTAADWDA